MTKPKSMEPRLSPDDLARFWSKVDKTAGCWLWRAGKSHAGKYGYGMFWADGGQWMAHRLSLYISTGLWPSAAGLSVLHKCDVPTCVNPAHLFLGSAGDNNRDRNGKGRTVSLRGEERPNAKLTDAAVMAIRVSDESQYVLAKRYGVSRPMIGSIIKRKRWKHVP